MIDSCEGAEALRQPFNFDHRLRHKEKWNQENRNAGEQTQVSSISLVPAFLIHCFNSSFHIWKINVRSHSGAQTIVVAGQTNLDSEHLLDPVRDGLHVARREFGLAIDLLDHAIE